MLLNQKQSCLNFSQYKIPLLKKFGKTRVYSWEELGSICLFQFRSIDLDQVFIESLTEVMYGSRCEVPGARNMVGGSRKMVKGDQPRTFLLAPRTFNLRPRLM